MKHPKVLYRNQSKTIKSLFNLMLFGQLKTQKEELTKAINTYPSLNGII
jgi:hypothetical protein